MNERQPVMHKGDTFIFHGLENSQQAPLELVILGISVGGLIQFRLEIPGTSPKDFGPKLHSCPYSEALHLIEQGIWKRKESNDTASDPTS